MSIPSPICLLRRGQLWLLETPGRQPRQLTREADPVRDFDISPADGSLAYLAGQRLLLARGDGSGRQVLLSAPGLPPAADEPAARNDRAAIAARLASPCFSPDGSRLAYIQDGLRALELAGGRSEALFANPPIPAALPADPVEGPLVLHGCLGWSPDGAFILAQTRRLPAAGALALELSLLDLGARMLYTSAGGAVHPAWSRDGRWLYAANPAWGGQYGLRRFDLADAYKRAALLGEETPARAYTFYGWPCCLPDGSLLVLSAWGPEPDKRRSAFSLSRLQPDGTGRRALRADSWDPTAALWAPDGSGAAVAAADRLVWLAADGSAPAVLDNAGADALRWAVPPGRIGRAFTR